MTTLTPAQIKFLRARAHPLEPSLKLGKRGLEAVAGQLETLLGKDELVKIRIGKRVEIDAEAVASQFSAALVQRLGHTVVLYRAAKQPVLRLPAS
jgi:RNA-binding protein